MSIKILPIINPSASSGLPITYDYNLINNSGLFGLGCKKIGVIRIVLDKGISSEKYSILAQFVLNSPNDEVTIRSKLLIANMQMIPRLSVNTVSSSYSNVGSHFFNHSLIPNVSTDNKLYGLFTPPPNHRFEFRCDDNSWDNFDSGNLKVFRMLLSFFIMRDISKPINFPQNIYNFLQFDWQSLLGKETQALTGEQMKCLNMLIRILSPQLKTNGVLMDF